MKGVLLASITAFVLSGPIVAPAQTRPDFSGHWRFNQGKSTPGATGNWPTVSFASELILTQSPTELRVEMVYPRVAKNQIVVYRLDDTEITVPLPDGIHEKARARWEGDSLFINAHRVVTTQFGEFASETKETWTRNGNVLTIRKSLIAEGLTTTETAVFEKAS